MYYNVFGFVCWRMIFFILFLVEKYKSFYSCLRNSGFDVIEWENFELF